jgi:hypothetical protein
VNQDQAIASLEGTVAMLVKASELVAIALKELSDKVDRVSERLAVVEEEVR